MVTLFDILFVVVLLYNVGLRNVTQINDITKSVGTRGYVELASRRMWIVFVSSNNSGRLSRGSFLSEVKPRAIRDMIDRVRVRVRVRTISMSIYFICY